MNQNTVSGDIIAFNLKQLVATDINMPQGQEAILTTDEEVHYAREYLTVKKEQQQRIEEIE